MSLSTTSANIKQEADLKPFKKPIGFTIDNLIKNDNRDLNTAISPSQYDSVSPSFYSTKNLTNSSLLNVSPSLANQSSPLSSSGSLSESSSFSQSSNRSKSLTSNYIMPQLVSPTASNGYLMLSNTQNQLMWQQMNQHQITGPSSSILGHQQKSTINRQNEYMSAMNDPQMTALHFHLQREQAFNMYRSGTGLFDPTSFNMSQCKTEDFRI